MGLTRMFHPRVPSRRAVTTLLTPPSPIRRPRQGFWLAGAVLLVTPFLYASPAGISLHRDWPWSWDASARSATGLADLATWFAAGLAALACGLGRLGAGTRAVATALVVLVAVRAHGVAGALPIERPSALGLGWTALLALLGGGAIASGSADAQVRKRAAAVLLTAAAGMAFLLAAWTQDGWSGVAHLFSRWSQVRSGLFLGAELEPETRAAMARDLTWYLVPPILQAAAAALAVVLALRARQGGAPAPSRPLAVAVVVLLAGSMLVALPGAMGAFGATVRGALSQGSGVLGSVLVWQGFAVWLAASAFAAAWLRDPATPSPPPEPELATRPGPRWPFVLAALALVALVFSAYHPDSGISRRAWPWDVARGSPWDTGVLPVFLAAASLAALLAAGVWRSSSVAATAAATTVVLSVDVLLRDAEREALLEATRSRHGCPSWPPRSSAPWRRAGCVAGARRSSARSCRSPGSLSSRSSCSRCAAPLPSKRWTFPVGARDRSASSSSDGSETRPRRALGPRCRGPWP